MSAARPDNRPVESVTFRRPARWLPAVALPLAIVTIIALSQAVRADDNPTAHTATDSTRQIDAQQERKDLEVIRQRLLETLMASPADARQVRQLMKSMQDDGSWADVPYDDRSSALWEPRAHLGRLVELAKALCGDESELKDNAQVREALRRGLSYWQARDPKSDNWWWNDIGGQLSLSSTLLIARDQLTPQQLERGSEVLARTKISLTGQNMLWMAQVNLRRAILIGDSQLARKAVEAMSAEIRISDGEGIRRDMSFHQHGACLYSLGYGRGFSCDGARLARLVQGTHLALPPEKVDLLVRYILDGQRWLFRGATGDVGASGRELTRPGWGNGSIASACDDLANLKVERADELRAFAAQLRGKSEQLTQLSGNRHYPHSDIMIHQRAGFYASARMHSDRLLNTDMPCNNEGMLNHLIADGASLLMVRGDEYIEIFPVWNWTLVPGITALQAELVPLKGVCRKGTNPFAGGVSDGHRGAAGFLLQRDGLSARKAWFFFDDFYVCLGTDITSSNADHAVATSINQCFLKGPVLLGDTGGGSKEVRTLDVETLAVAADVAWIHHDGVGYILGASSRGAATVSGRTQTGSWQRISKSRPADAVSHEVFSLSLDHGTKPTGAKYHYIVAPHMAATHEAAEAIAEQVVVLANEPDMQAVRHADGLTMAVIYDERGGSVELSGPMASGDGAATGERTTLRVDKDCLLMVRQADVGWQVTLSRPHHKASVVTVSIGEEKTEVKLSGGESQMVMLQGEKR